jgi:hypothetical protein
MQTFLVRDTHITDGPITGLGSSNNITDQFCLIYKHEMSKGTCCDKQ